MTFEGSATVLLPFPPPLILDEDYPIHCYDERYEIIATPINSNRLTDFNLKK